MTDAERYADIDEHADRAQVEIMRDGLRARIKILQMIESASRSLGQIRRNGSQAKFIKQEIVR